MSRRPWIRPGLLALLPLLLAGCSDLLHEGAPPAPVPLALTTSFAPAAPGLQAELAEVFDRTNRVQVRVVNEATGALLTEETLQVTPEEEGIRLRLNIDLEEEDRLRVLVSVVLLENDVVLFRGSFVTELVRGRPASGDVPLNPVPASLVASGPDRLTSLGETSQLSATLLMGTGDPIPDAEVTWTSLDQGVVQVDASGLATAIAEGTARVVARSQGLSDTVTIQVAAVVATVVVSPPSASLQPGDQRPFVAQARDARGNILQRTADWSASPASVATVDGDGLVTAVGVGTAVVQATVAGVSGTASVEVTAPAPQVETGGVAQISASSGELIGTVNPLGFQTAAWFEFGSSETLSEFQRTVELSVGSGLEPVEFRQFIEDLPAESTVYYRIAARSVGGESRGEVRSFETAVARPPRAPTRLRAEFFFLNESFAGFNLLWDVNSTNEEYFELDRWDSEVDAFLPLAEPGPGQSNFLDRFVEPFVDYDYRIRACNMAGCSSYSELFSVYYDFEG